MTTRDARWRYVVPPRLDPDNPFPSTDCQHEDLRDLFFVPDGVHQAPSVIEARDSAARAVCAGCPFLVECALHGLTHEDYGVWGGLSEQDRRRLGGRSVSTIDLDDERDPEAVVREEMAAVGAPEHTVARLLDAWRRLRREAEEVA